MPRPAERAYVLKVTLRDDRPPIWRRILVRARSTLDDLHWTILALMQFSGVHAYEFDIDGRLFMAGEQPDLETTEARETALEACGLAPGKKFAYVYDFGEFFQFEILVEQVGGVASGQRYPACIGGRQGAPFEFDRQRRRPFSVDAANRLLRRM